MLKKLEFPYKNGQIILSSDRVMLHSRKDAIILAGKRAVSLCSAETINLDAKEKIILDSDVVELGHEAQALGEQLVLGNSLVEQLTQFASTVESVGKQLSRVAENKEKIAASMGIIAGQGFILEAAAQQLKDSLQTVLSQNTFTR
jgi:hypothetical protein